MTTYETVITEFVSSAATTFAYRRFGATRGTPLLFLIHFRGTIDKWDPLLVNNIARSRPVILVDYSGIGHSTGRVATSVRDSASDIVTFLSLIGITDVDILGFSMVHHLIICGSSASVGPDMPVTENDYLSAATVGQLEIEHFKTLFFPHTAAGERACEEWWKRLQDRPAQSGETAAEWASQGFADEGIALKAQGEAYVAFLTRETSSGADGTYDRLDELKMPVLVAQGSDDFMFPTVNSFHLQQKVANGSLVVYPNSGHGFLYQYADLVAEHIIKFLS